MGTQEQYKIIGQLKAIKKRLDLICEKMGIEVSPLIKIEEEKQKKQLNLFIKGTGKIKNYD